MDYLLQEHENEQPSRHHRVGIDVLAKTTVRGRERAFLLSKFFNSDDDDLLEAGYESQVFGRTGGIGYFNAMVGVDMADESAEFSRMSFASHSAEFALNANAQNRQQHSQSDPSVDHSAVPWSSTLTNATDEGNLFQGPTRARLLEIPEEVLDMIISKLSWASKELLSRTCRIFRKRLQPKCSELHASMEESLTQYLLDLSWTMPTHVMCSSCFRLHRFLREDYPARRVNTMDIIRPCRLGLNGTFPDLAAGYHLEYHHVQLALKLYRYGYLEGMLENLLMPYYCQSFAGSTLCEMRSSVLPLVAVQEPEPSLLVYRTLDFFEATGSLAEPLSASTIQCMVVCPHTSFSENDSEDIYCMALHEAVIRAQKGQYSHRDFSCRRCPTDVTIDTSPGRLHVRIWHDFGGEGYAPMDNAWQVHVFSVDNNKFVGPSIPHDPGMVRARYELASRMQPPSKHSEASTEKEEHLLTWCRLSQAAAENRAIRCQGLAQLQTVKVEGVF